MANRSSRVVDPEALTESKILRDKEIAKASEDQAQRILRKVKHIFFALWNGTGYLTLKQVAEFYEVGEEAVRSLCRPERHKSELWSDGVRILRKQELNDAPVVLTGASTTSQLTVFPVRGILRVGFILRDSLVARQVRDVALNIIEGVGQFLPQEVLEQLIQGSPPLQAFSDGANLKLSVPLFDYWGAIKISNLEKYYQTGGIHGLTAKSIRDRIMALAGRIDIDGWDFKAQKQIKYQLTSSRYKYPDFSVMLPSVIDGVEEKVLFMFMFDSLIIKEDYVESCVGRNYITYAKEHLNINHAFLFFVAPFGATPDAEIYIKDKWAEEKTKGYVGVLTVKELAQLLCDQARACKNSNFIKGGIRKDFADLLTYQMPDPLLLLMNFPGFSSGFN
jgi:hypothetical protein